MLDEFEKILEEYADQRAELEEKFQNFYAVEKKRLCVRTFGKLEQLFNSLYADRDCQCECQNTLHENVSKESERQTDLEKLNELIKEFIKDICK